MSRLSSFHTSLLVLSVCAICIFPDILPVLAAGKPARSKPGQPRLTEAAVVAREVEFKITPQGVLKLHLFLPPGSKPADRRAAMIFFFGGGWKSGSFTQFVPQAEYFAGRGLVCACADYRISSIHKTTPDLCVEDAKSAVRWLRSHAAELGVDPGRIIASGGSAGGHLAAATWLVPGFDSPEDDRSVSCKPDALVLFNPALNLTNIDGREIPDAGGRNIAREISPTLFLSKETPPAILFFCTADKLAAHGREYVARAGTLGVRAELWTAAGMPHGFFNRSPWTEVTAKKADEFLASLGHLAGEPTIKLPAGAPDLERE